MLIRNDFSLNKNALNIGALSGLALSVIQFIAWFLSSDESPALTWSLYIILIISISWSVRRYRDISGGMISFGKALTFGLLLSFGASVVFAFTNYLYIKFIDPSYIETVLEQMELALYESGYDDEKVKMFMELYNTFFGPGMYAFAIAFNFTIIGLLSALVISFFVRSTRPIA